MPRPEQVVAQAPEADTNALPDQQRPSTDVATQALASSSPIAPEDANLQPTLPTQPTLPANTDVSGGYDEALFSPTDRPHEPITHGAPFGAGASFIPLPTEDNYTFLNRVGDALASTPDAQALAPYISAIRKGR